MEKTFAVGDRVYMQVHDTSIGSELVLSGVVTGSVMVPDNYSPTYQSLEYQVTWDFCPEFFARFDYSATTLHRSKNEALKESIRRLQNCIDFRVRNNIELGDLEVTKQKLLDMRDP